MKKFISLFIIVTVLCNFVSVFADTLQNISITNFYAEREYIDIEFNKNTDDMVVGITVYNGSNALSASSVNKNGNMIHAEFSEKLCIDTPYRATVCFENKTISKDFILKSYFKEDFEEYDSSEALYTNWISGVGGIDGGVSGAFTLISDNENKRMKMTDSSTAVAIPKKLYNDGGLTLKSSMKSISRYVFEGDIEMSQGGILQCGLCVGTYYGNGLSAPYVSASSNKTEFFIRSEGIFEKDISYADEKKSIKTQGYLQHFKTSVNGCDGVMSVGNESISFSYIKNIGMSVGFKTRGTNVPSIIDNVCIYAYQDFSFDLYVSPTGDNNASGNINNPLKTITAAKNKVQNIVKSGCDITIYLRGGEYPIEDTVSFTSLDSGSNNTRVIYKAYENEKPVFTGGKRISSNNFELVSQAEADENGLPQGSVGHVYKYGLKKSGITTDQLDYNLDEYKRGILKNVGYLKNNIPKRILVNIDGKALDQARYPNRIENEKYPENPYPSYLSVGTVLNNGKVSESGETIEKPVFTFNYENAKNWKNTDDIFISGALHTCFDYLSYRASGIDADEMTVSLERADAYSVPNKGARYFFENILQELDFENEYFITRDGIMYLYRQGDFSDKNVNITTYDKTYFINFNRCSYITLDGLSFDMTKGSFVKIMGGEYIDIKNCDFKNCSGVGISIGEYGYTANQMIHSKPVNTAEATGNAAYYQTSYNGKNHTIYGCNFSNNGYPSCEFSSGNALTLEKSNIVFENNLVENSGIFGNTYASGIVVSGTGYKIKNNKFLFSSGSAISGQVMDSDIVYNEFADCLSDGLEDMGVVYLNYTGSNLDVRIRYNYFHEVRMDDPRVGGTQYASRLAIYCDNGDFNKDINYNLFSRIPICGDYVDWYPNTISNNMYVDVQNSGTVSSYTLMRNKDYTFDSIINRYGQYPGGYYTIAPSAYSGMTAWEERFPWLYNTIDYIKNKKSDFTSSMSQYYNNIMVNAEIQKRVPEIDSESITVDEKYGKILNNKYYTGNIGFEDYENGNLQITPECAEKLGIEYQDYSKIGIYDEKKLESIDLRLIYDGESKVFDYAEGIGISEIDIDGKRVFENFDYRLNTDVINNNGSGQRNRLMLNGSLFNEDRAYTIKVKTFYGTEEEYIFTSDGETQNNYGDTYLNYGKYIGDLFTDFCDMTTSTSDDYLKKFSEIKHLCPIDENNEVTDKYILEKMIGKKYADIAEFSNDYNNAVSELKYPLTAESENIYERTGMIKFHFDNTENAYTLYVDNNKIGDDKYTINEDTLSVKESAIQTMGRHRICLASENKLYIGNVNIYKAAIFYDGSEKVTVKNMSLNCPQNPLSVIADEKENYVLEVTEDALIANAGINPLYITFGIDKRISEDYIYDDIIEINYKLTASKFGSIEMYFGNNINYISNYITDMLSFRYPYGHIGETRFGFSTINTAEFKVLYNAHDLVMRVWYKDSSGQWEEISYNKEADDKKYSDDYITLKNAGAFNSLQFMRNMCGTAKIEDITVRSVTEDMKHRIDMLDFSDKEAVASLKCEYDDLIKYSSEAVREKIDNSEKLILYESGVPFSNNTECLGNEITTELYNVVSGSRIFAASYKKDGGFTEVQSGISENGEDYRFVFNNPIDECSVKLFVWSSIGVLEPLAESIVLK